MTKLKFPYAISNFYSLITEGYFYIDRTNYISLLEKNWKYPLFLRPRRFGKSLLISMLQNYYDIAKADEFDKLFGHLAIGQNPTPNHNQYFVLDWDFSAVSAQGNIQQIQQNLFDHVNARIEAFSTYYQDYLNHKITINPNNASASFESLLGAVQQTPYHIYLLIDEYDNFANEVMMSHQETTQSRYEALVEGEGCLKALFKVTKFATKGGGVDRVFITGVSPVVMSDMTSGFNIAEDIYLDPDFNDLCGFSEAEIKLILEQLAITCDFSTAEIEAALNTMRSFYNGYAFTYNQEPNLYNPTLALYFLRYLQRFCQYPPEMLDENLSTDRNKLSYISHLPMGKQVIASIINEAPPFSIRRLAHRFGVKDMVHGQKDTPFMASLLYYLGMLTLAGRDQYGKLLLKIPNTVASQLYLDRLQEMLVPNQSRDNALTTAEHFYATADIQAVCNFIEETYFTVFDNRDYVWTKELNIKTLFLTLLFNDAVYMMNSEHPLKRGYADLTLLLRPDMRQYKLFDFLFEFKYLKLADLEMSGTDLKEKPLTDLMNLTLIKESLEATKAQLKKYHSLLHQTHPNLRLRSFGIVSLGYERLLWVEI